MRHSCAVFAAAAILIPAPGFAQIPMPDPREMAGIPRSVDDLPNGTISVRLIRGQLSNNIPNHPIELHGAGDVRTAKTDETGRAQFSGLAAGTMVRAVANVGGERLESQPFAAPASGGIRLLLVATDRSIAPEKPPAPLAPVRGTVVFGGQTRFIVEPVDQAVQVYYLLDIQNSARAPVEPAAPIVFDLPAGAQSATILQGSSPQAIAKGNRVTIVGPFQPGGTAVQVAYQMPQDQGELDFVQRVPIPMQQVGLVVRKIGLLQLHSPQITNRQEVTAEGQTYIMASGPPIGAGQTVSVALSGLPHHSPLPRRVAVGLALVCMGAGLWAAARAGASGSERRQRLEARREKLFGDLVRIEEQQRTGAIDRSRYAARRESLIAQLERVYGELDTGL